MAARGRLLVFEGAEGAGKTTQVELLAARLAEAGVPHARFREPGGTPLGDAVRGLLLDPAKVVAPRAEALLFMAARAQLAAHLEARLAAGDVVLLDRFFLSTHAYQVAGRGLPADGVRAANQLAVGALVPDLTVLLVADAPVARARMLARGDPDRMEREDGSFHARVAAAYEAAADPGWQRLHPEAGPIVRVDAGGPPDAVAGRVWALLLARWPETFRADERSQAGRDRRARRLPAPGPQSPS